MNDNLNSIFIRLLFKRFRHLFASSSCQGRRNALGLESSSENLCEIAVKFWTNTPEVKVCKFSFCIWKMIVWALPFTLFAYEENPQMFFGDLPHCWMISPLLTPDARVESMGVIKVQPYLNTFVKVGRYDAHWHAHSLPNFYSEQIWLELKTGIAPRVDFQITPVVFYNETENRHSFGIGDTLVALNLRLYSPKKLGDGPTTKLALLASLPLGKYRNFHPSLLKTDEGGSGSWFPGTSVVISNLWYLYGAHYLELRSAIICHFGVPVHVKGYNTYGGDHTTNGTVYPGSYGHLEAALQYSLTQRWVLSCDFRYTHKDRSRFSGHTVLPVGRPSSEIISIAPAVQYNWSNSGGVIGGVWFSVGGRNTDKFINNMIYADMHF